MVSNQQPAWARLADALLARDALLVRIGDGVPPRDFPGLYVDHADVERIAATLPGLDGPTADEVAPLRGTLDPIVERHRTAFRHALSGDDRFVQLMRAAGLSEAEAEVLAVVAAVEADPRRQRLVSYAQDSMNLPRLTLATLGRLFGEDGRARAVAAHSRLVRSALVEVDEAGPWATRMVSAAPRVIWALCGDESPDTGLPVAARCDGPVTASAPQPGLVLVTGADRTSRQDVIRARWPLCGQLVTPIPEGSLAWKAVVREATVAGRVVVLEVDEGLDAEACAWIERADHLAWVISSPRELPLDALPDRPWEEIHVDDGQATDEDWRRLLGCDPVDGYRLSRDQLRLVAHAANGDQDVATAVRRLAGGHLDALAIRIRPRRGWDDLVLPADQRAQLQELTARYRRRTTVYESWGFRALPSAGVIALFQGPSGTGKTLTAEVIAGDLGLDLYKVDLSSVVSKYIGETEKNLERIFSAAAAGDLVLFFDEADALFGKRSEVSDAHDRYANIEVAYLLQRLESYDGFVILATNLQRNIDQAFLRRISVAVEFPQPDEAQRRAIWQRAFPPGAPVEALDLEFLARQFKVTGGVIRNTALGAAFLAAEAGVSIDMERVVLALKREFQKLGRLRTEADFDRYFVLVNREPDAAPVG